MASKTVTPKTRFAVFERDRFTCQYCGKSAPDIELQIDHVVPVSKGGSNAAKNLVTSCQKCNAGKGAEPIDNTPTVCAEQEQVGVVDDTKAAKMAQLHKETNLRSGEVDAICDYFGSYWGCEVTDSGKASVRKLLKSFGFDLTMQSTVTACDSYSDRQKAFDKIGGIATITKRKHEDPKRYWAMRLVSELDKVFPGKKYKWDLVKFLTSDHVDFRPDDNSFPEYVKSWGSYKDYADLLSWLIEDRQKQLEAAGANDEQA